MSTKSKRKKVDGWFLADEKHKTVLRDFVTKRSHCADKGCKFHGKLAEQGVCYSRVDTAASRYFAQSMKDAENMLAFNWKHNYKKLSQKQVIKRLESEVVCHFMNYTNCLAELVWLRGENAKMRERLGVKR